MIKVSFEINMLFAINCERKEQLTGNNCNDRKSDKKTSNTMDIDKNIA